MAGGAAGATRPRSPAGWVSAGYPVRGDWEAMSYTGPIPPATARKVIARFPLGHPTDLRPGGGTASPKTVFACDGDRYLLRRRRSEFCPENRVRFDHAFVRHLAESGLPVAPPLGTREGRTWVVEGEHTYEIVPFIEGLSVRRFNSRLQILGAATALGRIHQASGSFVPPTVKDLGRDLYLPRYLPLIESELRAGRGQGMAVRRVAERMLRMAREVIADVERVRPDEVAPTTVHGDFTPGNVLFRGERVQGIFDFDWATITSRVWDVARGILHFAFRRRTPLDPDDIRSLTEAMTPDLERACDFVETYTSVAPPLNRGERAILPLFIREALLCMRIGGMRKLPEAERLDYAVRDMEPLLDWMETAVESFVSGLTEGA